MKTRHLSAALMLPVLFTACTNEEFTDIQQSVSVSDRPMAGKVTFNFTAGGDADSRLTTDFKWEKGDQIGATLMDEYTPNRPAFNPVTGYEYMKDFTFVSYIQSNYKYTNNGEGSWANDNLLAKGNYFFYYPYDAKLNARDAFTKVLNANQVVDLDSPRQLINDNQMYVGYKFVEGSTEGDEEVLTVTMDPVFAFPAFTIKNTGTQTYTITKIALQKKINNVSQKWDLLAIINPKDKESKIKEIDENVAEVVTITGGEKGEYKAEQIQVTMPENTTLSTGQSLNTYIVVPAGEYANATVNREDVTLYIYTTTGVVTADLSTKHVNSGGTTEYNVTNDVAFADVQPYKIDGKYFHCNVTFSDLAVSEPTSFNASSTEDLDMYLSWFKNYSGTGATELTVNTLNDNVSLSKESYEILKNNNTLKVKFVGNLTLAEGVGADVLDLITIDNFVARTITNFATINVPATLGNNITLVNKGTATLNNYTKAYGYNFVNKGTIIVNAGVNKTVTVDTDNENKFINDGILNIQSGFTVVNHGIKNNGTVNIEAAVTNAKIDNNFTVEGASYVAGTINVAEGATWELYGTLGTNNGLIVNKGTINVPAKNAKYETQATKTYNNNKTYVPKIENYGTVKNVTNSGLVVMADAKAVLSSNSESTGYVDNTICNSNIVKNGNEKIFIELNGENKASEIAKKVASSNAHELRLSGKVIIDPAENAAEQKVVVRGENVELSVIANGNLTFEPVAKNDKVWFAGSKDANAAFTVNKETTTTVAPGAILAVGKVTCNGKMIVQASATVIAANEAGENVTVAGTWINRKK